MTPRGQRIWHGAQTALITAGLAVVLWVWADGRLRAPADLELTVAVQAGGRGVSPSRFVVHVRVEGPQKSVADFRAATAAPGAGELIYAVPADEADKAGHTVRVLEWLRGHELFRGRGINVEFASPQTVDVELEREFVLPVVLEDQTGAVLDTAALGLTVQPPTMKARMLRATHGAMRSRVLRAVLDRTALDQAVATRPAPGAAPPSLPAPLMELPGVRTAAPSVTVLVTQRTRMRTLQNLPILLVAAEPAYWRDWVPAADPKLLRVSVTVQGPADLVDGLRPEQVVAYVVLGPDNTRDPPLDTEIRFSLPGGVEVVRSDTAELRSPEPPRINCPLKRRPMPAAGSGGD